jgi:ComF family protein
LFTAPSYQLYLWFAPVWPLGSCPPVDENLRMSWRMAIRKIGAAAAASKATLETAIMPRCCVFCGVECKVYEDYCCRGCMQDLPWNDNQCPTCAEPQQTPLVVGLGCAACQAAPPPFVAAAAPFRYAFPVDAAIKLLKFRRRLEYSTAFGALMAGMLATLPADIDGLLPVPLHWRRQAARGFNQADELCREVRWRSGLAVIRGARRVRATPYQSGLERAARARNLKAAFAVQGNIAARHVLVIDDVITTGATCRELARELLLAGVARVSVLALARR